MVMTLVLIYFGRPPLGHTIKTNFKTFQTVDLEIFSIFIFHKRAWNWVSHHILCVIFQKIFLMLYSVN